MTTLGIDIAWARPNPNAVYAAGYRFAIGYLSHDSSKNMPRSYIDALHAAGLYVGLNWESTATRAAEGGPAGTADGMTSGQQLQALGAPRSMVIPFAVDHDYAPSQVIAYARAYQAGIARYGYKSGVYGSLRVEEALRAAGLATREWQTVAWSGGHVDGSADLYQRSTHSHAIAGMSNSQWDEDVLFTDESWFWGPAGHLVAQAPVQTTTINKTPVHPALTQEGHDVAVYLIGKSKEYPTGAVYAYGESGIRRITPEENNSVVRSLVAAQEARYLNVPDGVLDTIRVVA